MSAARVAPSSTVTPPVPPDGNVIAMSLWMVTAAEPDFAEMA